MASQVIPLGTPTSVDGGIALWIIPEGQRPQVDDALTPGDPVFITRVAIYGAGAFFVHRACCSGHSASKAAARPPR